jgi:hypothetical protein
VSKERECSGEEGERGQQIPGEEFFEGSHRSRTPSIFRVNVYTRAQRPEPTAADTTEEPRLRRSLLASSQARIRRFSASEST